MAARKFVPSLHPRDRFGRFTRSRSASATAEEKKQAAAVAGALKPKRGVTGPKAGDYLRGISPDRDEAVAAYTAGGHEQTHKALRAGRTGDPSVKAMDAAMVDLPDDLVVSRRVPLSAFGDTDLDGLAGLKVRDAAFSPTAIGAVRATKTDVRMRIAVPRGTRAAVDPDTGEVILDRDLEMVVARVEDNSAGGKDVWLTVLPKAGTGQQGKTAPKGRADQAVDTGRVEAEPVPVVTAADPGVSEYQNVGKYVNDHLRGDLKAQQIPEDRSAAAVKQLDDLFDRLPPVRQSTTVYRGLIEPESVRTRQERSIFGDDDPTGRTFTDPGFMSTSDDRDAALRFAGSYGGATLLEVEIPAGFKAAKIAGSLDHEAETLLPRDTSFEVVSERYDGDVRILQVRLTRKDGTDLPGLPDASESPAGGAGGGADRASLMKLRVPELQARMRERGLKPGKLRKTQLVDALINDELGEAAPAGSEDRESLSFQDSSSGPAGAEVTRVAGTDRLDEIRAEGLKFKSFNHPGPWDEDLALIAARQGFDAPPRLADAAEIDAAVADGWTEVWRGIVDHPSASAAEQQVEFWEGPWRPGRGTYGNGMYVSTRRATADAYADGWGGTVMRIAIDPGARIVEYQELVKEFKAWRRTLPNKGELPFDLLGFRAQTDEVAFLQMFRGDVGRFAAAGGYDAYVISRKDDGAENYKVGERRGDQYVILNRSAVMVEG